MAGFRLKAGLRTNGQAPKGEDDDWRRMNSERCEAAALVTVRV